MTDFHVFDCGCKMPIIGYHPDNAKYPLLDWNIEETPFDCKETWKLIGTGRTKGIFQLESQLGQQWAKKIAPESIEEISAIGALMRPGCVHKDSKILVHARARTGRKYGYHRVSIEKLCKNKHLYSHLISYNEESGKLEKNKMIDVFYTGVKEVFSVKISKRTRKDSVNSLHDLKCTDDHPLLTNKGWKQLKHLVPGDRVAVLSIVRSRKSKNFDGEKYFRERCFKHYEYNCVFCDWKEASLDVNHIEGNRKSNNHPDNLNFMCPNHHKMFSEKLISKESILEAREKYRLPQSEDVEWAEYQGKESLGFEDVYDISMEAPHHNFIADNFVVHNCLRAISDGKSMTQHYADRKNGKEEVQPYHPAVDSVLEPTYGVLTYQEQAMRLCVAVAGFNEQEADGLRKAIGKKIAQEMAAVKRMFIEKTKALAIISEAQADEIFGWIEKSQRYSFNKSHAVAYGIEGYWCAYAKFHFTKAFFTSWLRNSTSDQKPKDEVAALVNDAKLFSIEVKTPDFRNEESNFHIKEGLIRVGIGNVKGVGESVLDNIAMKSKTVEIMCGKPRAEWNWMDILILFSKQITAPAFLALINSGSFSYLGKPRTTMAFEYDKWQQLTDGERDWINNEYLSKKWANLKEALVDAARPKKEGGAAKSTRGLEKMKNLIISLDNPGYEMKDLPDFVASQEEILIGCPITYNRIDSCETSLANCTCKEFVQGKQIQNILMAAEISDVRVNTIKTGPNQGKKMAFLKVYDGTCALDNILLFSEGYTNYGNLLIKGNTIMLDGYRSRDNAFIVNKVEQV